MQQFIAKLPKAELHLHLEGCVEQDTLWELAQHQRSPLAAAGRSALDAVYRTTEITAFLQAFKTVCQHLKTPQDYERVTYRALRRLAQQNVRYAEITLSAGVILWKGEDLLRQFQGIEAGYQRARKEFPIRVQWIFDAVRQFGPEAAMAVARAAAALQDRGVIALGLGGDERQGPAEWFQEVFAYARSEGLRLTAHAGETEGPDSIWNALQLLGAERIGHGLAAARDARLVDYLSERHLPIEICLTSNRRTGSLAALSLHPLPHFLEKGLQVCLNTDDPALFGTDLNREYLLAHQLWAFGREELTRLAQNSFRAAFLKPEEIESHLRSFQPTPVS
ncbi:MAG: adenosine deaminase [Acidobacteria bacterium]|nr:adenosine deaminase [Acidobacteriota bacterium]